MHHLPGFEPDVSGRITFSSSDATGQLPIAVETIPTFFGNAPAQEDGMTQRLMQMVN